LITTLAGLVLVLAACGGGETGASTTEVTETTPGASTTMGSNTTMGSETTTSGEFAGTIKLGAAVSDTGTYAREGQDTRQGYDLWVDWVNNEYGGIKVGDDRYNVEIVYYDDEGDADTAANLVERLITEDGVDFLLGPYSSGLTMSTSAIAEKYNVIMVEGNGASEGIFERGFKNIFAVLTPAKNYTQSALQALSDQGAQSVVVAYEDTAFPTSVAEGAQEWADEYGMDVLGVETYPADVSDVSSIITGFKSLQPDVFVGGGHYKDALLFVRAAKEADWTPQGMVITVGPSNPDFVDEVGADAEYIIGPTQWERTMSWEDEWFGTAEDWAVRYEGLWGEPPSYQAAESTATALALHLAIEAAGSLDSDAVRQALYDLDVTTFYGPIDFDDTGKNTAKPMGSIQIQDGAINVIAPEGAAVADLRYPMAPWSER
jgi:branched-chain amino acid transport system substrate-binding protein